MTTEERIEIIDTRKELEPMRALASYLSLYLKPNLSYTIRDIDDLVVFFKSFWTIKKHLTIEYKKDKNLYDYDFMINCYDASAIDIAELIKAESYFDNFKFKIIQK